MMDREAIIVSMCYTTRHDYGIIKSVPTHDEQDEWDILDGLRSGMTRDERDHLYRQMSQLYDNCIAPYMEFKK